MRQLFTFSIRRNYGRPRRTTTPGAGAAVARVQRAVARVQRSSAGRRRSRESLVSEPLVSESRVSGGKS